MLFVILFCVNRSLIPITSRYRLTIAEKASQLIKHPVEIGGASLSWHGIQPVIEFHHVAIFDNNHNFNLISADHLDIGINIWQSLLQKQIVLRTILISGVHLTIQQSTDGEWIINGMSNFTPNVAEQNPVNLQEFLSWLIALRQVNLHDVSIDWYDPNGKLWSLYHLKLKLESTGNQYNLSGNTSILQNNIQGYINFDGAAQGDINDFSTLQITTNIETKQLNAGPILQLILTHFPIWQNTVIKMHPSGEINGLAINYQGHGQQAADWQITAQVKQINWLRNGDIPGVENLSGALELTPSLQTVHIDSQNITLDFGKLFNAPITLDHLLADANLTKNNDILMVQTGKFVVDNADLYVTGSNALIIPLQNPGQGSINLNAQFKLNDGTFAHVKSYLPLTIISPEVIDWLNNSIQATGRSSGVGTLILRGPFGNFPYADGTGQFLIDSQLNNFNLNYYPGWPSAQQLSGKFIFSGNAMNAELASGQLLNIPISQIHATIPDLSQDATLFLNGNINGNLADAMNFVQNSPLKKTIGTRLQAIKLFAPMQMNLNLSIPLESNSKKSTQVQGHVIFNDGVLALPAWQLQLPHLNGQFQFDENGFSADKITATLLNNPISLSIKTIQPDKVHSVTQINAQGMIDITQLKNNVPEKIRNNVQGTTQYQALLELPSANRQAKHLVLTSQLKGITVNLAQPFKKLAAQSVNFKLETYFGNVKTHQLQMTYGNNTVQLNYDATGKTLQQISMHLAQLINYNQSLSNVDIQATRLPSAWDIAVTNPNFNGRINLPDNYTTQTIQGQFSVIKLQSSPSNNNAVALKPTDIPPLNLMSNLFSYGDVNLEGVQLQLQPQANGIAITRAVASGPSYNSQASGSWVANKSQGNITNLKGKLQSNNLEATLLSWGLPDGITGKNAVATFNLNWNGAPYRFNLATLQGLINLNLKQGLITDIGSTSKTKMELGKLFNVISLRTISQILKLDFKDIAANGFPYDTFNGDFYIFNGVANTKNALIDGPLAQIAFSGNLNLNNQTYNLYLQVTPHMTSSLSLPLIATIAGGPVAGIVVLAANRILGSEVQKIAISNYTVTGSWKNPIITQLSSISKTTK